MSAEEKFENFMRRVVGDPELRGKLQADASGTLEAQGIDIPQGAEIRVVEDSADVRHVVLPANPNAMLSDDSLSAASGGTRPVFAVPTGSTFADYFDPF